MSRRSITPFYGDAVNPDARLAVPCPRRADASELHLVVVMLLSLTVTLFVGSSASITCAKQWTMCRRFLTHGYAVCQRGNAGGRG